MLEGYYYKAHLLRRLGLNSTALAPAAPAGWEPTVAVAGRVVDVMLGSTCCATGGSLCGSMGGASSGSGSRAKASAPPPDGRGVLA